MTAHDSLHASIAAGLVEAGLTFESVLTGSGDDVLRAFLLPYSLNDKEFTVAGYVAGSVLVALVPMAVPSEARRYQISDAIAVTMPLVRVLPNPPKHPAPSTTMWIEAAIPLSPVAGEPIPPWLASAPFRHVAAAARFVLDHFKDVTPVADVATPHFASGSPSR